MKQIAYDFLTKDEILHIDMLEVMRHESYQLLYASKDGVLLYNDKAEVLMLSVHDLALGGQLIREYLPKYPAIVLHQVELEPIVKEFMEVHERIECYQQIFNHQPQINMPVGVEIKQVSIKEHELIYHHYSHDSDPKYLLEMIESGWVYGIYENNQLAGFIGRHFEGSIGVLEVLANYQRKGYATYLLEFMIIQFQQRGWVAFTQVEKSNQASLKLHQRLQAEASKSTVLWLV